LGDAQLLSSIQGARDSGGSMQGSGDSGGSFEDSMGSSEDDSDSDDDYSGGDDVMQPAELLEGWEHYRHLPHQKHTTPNIYFFLHWHALYYTRSFSEVQKALGMVYGDAKPWFANQSSVCAVLTTLVSASILYIAHLICMSHPSLSGLTNKATDICCHEGKFGNFVSNRRMRDSEHALSCFGNRRDLWGTDCDSAPPSFAVLWNQNSQIANDQSCSQSQHVPHICPVQSCLPSQTPYMNSSYQRPFRIQGDTLDMCVVTCV